MSGCYPISRWIVLGLVLAAGPTALRAQSLFDDWGDGSFADCAPVFWEINSGPDGWPGIYQVVAGDLVLRKSSPGRAIIWNGQVEGNVSVRARGTVSGGGDLELFVNSTPSQGYTAVLANSGALEFRRYGGGIGGVLVAGVLEEYVPGEDHVLQFDTQGDTLSFRVWRPDEELPEEPQLTVDDTLYRTGSTLLSVHAPTGGVEATYRYAWIQPESIATNPPRAAFAVSVDPAEVDQELELDARVSTTDSGHSFTSYGWDFGDGTTGGGETVLHSFEAPGRYDVTLLATDDRGLTSGSVRSITIAGLSGDVSPWVGVDVGETAYPGSARLEGEGDARCLVLVAGGEDVSNEADEFHFVYQPVTGDVQLTMRIDEYTSGRSFAKLGVMLREARCGRPVFGDADRPAKHPASAVRLPGSGGRGGQTGIER